MTTKTAVKAKAPQKKIARKPLTERKAPPGVQLGKLTGVGVSGTCACDDLEQAMDAPIDATPTVVMAYQEFALPLTETEINTFFSDTSNPLSPTAGPSPGRVTSVNLVDTDTVPCDLYLKGIGVVFRVEQEGWGMSGGAYTPPDPDTDTPAFSGVPAFSAEADDPRPATAEWGYDTWRALAAFLLAYELEFFCGCRFQLMSELVANIGYCGNPGTFGGTGTSLQAAMAKILAMNTRAREIDKGRVFLPATTDDDGNPLPPAMVSQVWGAPELGDSFSGIYRLKKPIMLPRGMPIRIQFRRVINESAEYAKLVEALGDPGPITYDENWTETIDGDVGFAGSIRFKGGRISVGVCLKAWELSQASCLEYVNGAVYGIVTPGNARAGVAGAEEAKRRVARLSATLDAETKKALHEMYTFEGKGAAMLMQYAAQQRMGLAGADIPGVGATPLPKEFQK